MTWIEHLKRFAGEESNLLDETFLARWGGQTWTPIGNDRKAAEMLHTQVISRITTQPLSYLNGVEKTALESIYSLFAKTREICDQHPCAWHFKTVVWYILNSRVRPFTAKWHPVSKRGGLEALDATDEFRADLAELQITLCDFEDLLLELRNGKPPPPRSARISDARKDAIIKEMAEELAWRIPEKNGGLDQSTAGMVNKAEHEAIKERRKHYWPPEASEKNKRKVEQSHATGLALSGGGIRSATFSLGVLVALARRGILPQFDYLSTVSGGGYLGSFLSSYLNTPTHTAQSSPITQVRTIGLRQADLPFYRENGEADALRHLRHHSKYLANGTLSGRLGMVFAQLYGMVLNGLGVVFVATIFVLLEFFLRKWSLLAGLWNLATTGMALILALVALVTLVLLRLRLGKKVRAWADWSFALIALILLALLGWKGLESCHNWFHKLLEAQSGWPHWNGKVLLSLAGAVPVIASAFWGVFGRVFKRAGIILIILATISGPLFFFGIYLLIYNWFGGEAIRVFEHGPFEREVVVFTLVVAGSVAYFLLLNINFTSPHRHYRNKLAEAYVIQPEDPASPIQSFKEDAPILLSEMGTTNRAPYHLLNAALNVPTSSDSKMQGRLTDFFLFSREYCGSPLIGYQPTKDWQKKDPHLDLGTAMAISGAAASPQMGLGTIKSLRFWLALLNIRLGYWVHHPHRNGALFGGAPGLWFLLKEMFGRMDENSAWLNVSDGGHIENLGVYELLRRRCQYIVAVDGEQDERMTFAGLTNLQRLAAIDLGVQIHIDLDDLRLNEKGLSRSHFRFCRIEYPDEPNAYGYLLYVKLSLTGNEGEFLRRYRHDEPAFPHHSTADQFFSESQFEAYRSLGEHVGDKLFLRAIIGELADQQVVEIEDWFGELGKSLLEQAPKKTPKR